MQETVTVSQLQTPRHGNVAFMPESQQAVSLNSSAIEFLGPTSSNTRAASFTKTLQKTVVGFRVLGLGFRVDIISQPSMAQQSLAPNRP